MYKTPERSTPRRQPCSGALTSCPHVLTCCFVCTRTGDCISVLPARVQVHSAAQCCTIHAFPHMPTPLTNMPLFVFTRFFSLNHPDVALCASYRTTSAAAAARPSHGAAWCAHHSSHTHTQYFMFVGLSCHPVAAQRSPQHTHSHITTEPR